MSRATLLGSVQALASRSVALSVLLFGTNLVFNVVANASFKLSAGAGSWRGVLAWQVVGNLAGLVTVITLTLILRNVPLHVAFPVVTGLAVVGVQVFAATLFFHEPIAPSHWLGTLLVVAGIALIGGR